MLTAAERARDIDPLQAQQQDALEQFARLLATTREIAEQKGVSPALRHIIQETGYRQQMIDELAEAEEELDHEEADNLTRRVHDLDDFLRYVEEFDREIEQGVLGEYTRIRELLDQLSTLSPGPDMLSTHRPAGPSDRPMGDAVTLMSIHAAKGLEAPCIYVVGLEEGVFPVTPDEDNRPHWASAKESLKDPEIAEESRLFYVAVTRAEDHLVLSSSRTREMRRGHPQPMPPSRYVQALPETLYVQRERGR